MNSIHHQETIETDMTTSDTRPPVCLFQY